MHFHNTTLANGLQVVAELNDQARSVASGFFVKAGSRDESPKVAGVSHFLEHMVFKGTPRRDALAVNRDFDRVGAKHNAQTSEEDTFYYVACLPEYLPRAFEVLSDILRPSLRDDDFETEKKVIVEEIRMYLDNPMMVAYEAAKAAHYGAPARPERPGQHRVDHRPGSRRDAGVLRRAVQPGNMVLAFAGNIGWDEAVGLAERHCLVEGRRGDPPCGPAARLGLVPDDPPRRGPAADRHRRRRRPAAGERRPLRGAAAGQRAGGSPRVEALLGPDRPRPRRRRRGLVPGLQPGGRVLHLRELRARRGPGQPRPARRRLPREALAGITDDELTQAKNKVLSRSVLRGERPMGRLSSLGFLWAYRHEYLSVADELDAYSRVTLADLRRLVAEWPLLPMTIVSVGPTVDLVPPV